MASRAAEEAPPKCGDPLSAVASIYFVGCRIALSWGRHNAALMRRGRWPRAALAQPSTLCDMHLTAEPYLTLSLADPILLCALPAMSVA